MATRAPRVCGHCNGVHASGERCGKVASLDRERKARFDRKRPNSSQRGYDREWEREAKAFLSLPENASCAQCGDPATVVMHKISIRRAPHLRMEKANWRPGCQRCNAKEAAVERRILKGKRT